MKLDFSPRVAAAHVDLAWPLGAHLLLREKDDEAEGRAGTPLALHAVTDGDTRRLASHLRAQRPAAAMGDPGHEKNPPVWRLLLPGTPYDVPAVIASQKHSFF